MTELEQIQYNDVMTDLAAIIDKEGARTFLLDFRQNYPRHFNQLHTVFNAKERQVPKLLMKDV